REGIETDAGDNALEGSASRDAVIGQNDRYIVLDVAHLETRGAHGDQVPVPGTRMPSTRGLPACSASTASNLEWVGDTSASPAPASIRLSGDFVVSGWAIDKRARTIAGDIDVAVDSAIVPSLYGTDRPDVARYFDTEAYRASGFVARLTRTDVASGTHILSIRILASDRRCFYQGPAVSIVVN